MGCAPSTIGEESMSRCKQRKLLMKQAIVAHSAFSASHTACAAALLSTGFAFRRYAHGEVTAAEISAFAIREPPLKRIVPIVVDAAVLKESVKTKQKRGVSKTASNDDVSLKSAKARETKQGDTLPVVSGWDYFSVNLPEVGITDDNDEEDEELEFLTPDNVSKLGISDVDDDDEAENSLPKQFMHSETASDSFRRAINANWSKGLKEISDEFLKASECAQEVSRLLVPNRYRLHHNSADNKARIDHAARVMRVITWNPSGDGINANDAKENEPLAEVLFKLLEWEKKLYDDVKAGGLMKLEYQRKLVLLATQKRRGASIELLMETKADVRHLRTSYVVEMQLIDSTVSEINKLRDRQLYPKLVELVVGMANMWENVSLHHNNQLRVATDLKTLEISAISRETTLDQYEQTTKLLSVVEGWQTQFKKHMTNQKSYISALNTWLNLNLIPIRNNLKEKLSSSSKRNPNPPIRLLLCSWHEYVEKLPHEPVMMAISSFTATLETVVLLQEEEMKMKEKREETRNEYLRKSHAFEEWLHKHNKCTVGKDSASARRIVIESLKRRLDEETEDHRKLCLRVRAKSVRSLRMRLPELLRATTDYAHACVDAYNRLMCIALFQNSTNVDGEPS